MSKLQKLAAKVLAKEVKRQVIAKQRGWYNRQKDRRVTGNNTK